MTAFDLYSAIRARFEAQVQLPLSLPTVYDNGPDTHPDDSLWARWTIQVPPGGTRQVQISVPVDRTTGVAIAQVFQPVAQGDKAALDAGVAIANAFRRVTDNGVRFKVPTVRTVGRDGGAGGAGGKWWQVNVICPFECDEIP